MQYVYKTKGVCSREIVLEIDENNRIQKAVFHGGCPGNTAGISKLVVGMDAEQVVQKVKGTRCMFKPTSCPDQLECAIEEALAQK